jgi:hypothetical protein
LIIDLTGFGILILAQKIKWHLIFNNISTKQKLQQASLQKNEGIFNHEKTSRIIFNYALLCMRAGGF